MDLVKIRTEVGNALAPGGIYLGDDSTAGIFVETDEPDKVELPVAFLGFPNSIVFDQNYAGGVRLEYEIFLIVDRAESKYAQLRLASAVSTVDTQASIAAVTESGESDGVYIPSIKQLLEQHVPDDGAWTSISVDSIDGYGAYDVGSIRGLGVTFSGRISFKGLPPG